MLGGNQVRDRGEEFSLRVFRVHVMICYHQNMESEMPVGRDLVSGLSIREGNGDILGTGYRRRLLGNLRGSITGIQFEPRLPLPNKSYHRLVFVLHPHRRSRYPKRLWCDTKRERIFMELMTSDHKGVQRGLDAR
jgi:hypothetical protein